MKKFPFQKQMDAMDCGPSCLQMIARHYGRILPIEQLRRDCAMTRNGVTLGGIADAAEKNQLKTVAIKASLQMLEEDVILPCVAHWRQRHFVVVYAIDAKYVYVADPAYGLVKYSKQEFVAGWLNQINPAEDDQGILLLLDTTAEFYQGEDWAQQQASGLGFLLPYFRPYRALFLQLFLGLLVGSLMTLSLPFMTQALVDHGINYNNLNFVYILLGAQLTLFLSQTSVEILRSWILLHIGARINIAIISDFLLKLIKLPIAFFDSKSIGDLLQRIHDHQRIEEFLSSATLTTLFSLVNVFVFSLVLAWYNLQILFIFLFGASLYVSWVLMFMKKRAELDYKRFDQAAKTQSSLVQMIYGMQEIKLNNSERRRRWEWEGIQIGLFKVSMKSLSLFQYQSTGANFINELKNILITFYCAKSVIDGNMTLGMMLSVQYIIGQLNVPLTGFVSFMQSMQDAKISLKRLSEVHGHKEEQNTQQQLLTLPQNKHIALRDNVCFRYGRDNSPLILDHINIDIPQGKVTAIVGASGSGKTTLLKLLLGFYPPGAGSIKIGSSNLSDIDTAAWRQQCGVVMQDGFIFNDSLLRNITESEPSGRIDPQRLQNAIDIANLEDIIRALPDGMNTLIGADGISLSGGQNQRVLIARAVYKNPQYLFFDEATSALDAKNERQVLQQLDQFMQGKTAVIIAHRLSTVKNADQILVLDQGRIIESGHHQQLVIAKGPYYQLVKNQLELGE